MKQNCKERQIGCWGLIMVFILLYLFFLSIATILEWITATGFDKNKTLVDCAMGWVHFHWNMITGFPSFINKLLHNIY